MGDREYREINEDITVHLSSIWLRCGMKYQGFVYDWALLWELHLFSYQVASTSFMIPWPKACRGILQARILDWVAISFSRGLPDPAIELASPAWQVDSLPLASPGKPSLWQTAEKSIRGQISAAVETVMCSTWPNTETSAVPQIKKKVHE